MDLGDLQVDLQDLQLLLVALGEAADSPMEIDPKVAVHVLAGWEPPKEMTAHGDHLSRPELWEAGLPWLLPKDQAMSARGHFQFVAGCVVVGHFQKVKCMSMIVVVVGRRGRSNFQLCWLLQRKE